MEFPWRWQDIWDDIGNIQREDGQGHGRGREGGGEGGGGGGGADSVQSSE